MFFLHLRRGDRNKTRYHDRYTEEACVAWAVGIFQRVCKRVIGKVPGTILIDQGLAESHGTYRALHGSAIDALDEMIATCRRESANLRADRIGSGGIWNTRTSC